MSSNRADVTVVIPCHNLDRWRSIFAAVESVRHQQVSNPHIVLSVDHNPALADRLRDQFTDLEVVRNQSGTRGASATRNLGVAATESPIVAFLDDDEIAEPDWLTTLIAPLADDAAIVGTGGRYEPSWNRPKPAWFPDELAWTVGGHHSGMPMVNSTVRNVWSGNMAVRRDVFATVGGFRLGFGKVGARSRPEDTDLCIRMAAEHPGGHWLYLPGAVIHHDVPLDRSTFAFFIRRCYAEGRGKVEMNNELVGHDALADERRYLRHTIPVGIGRHLRHRGVGALRAGAIVLGIGAAGAGAAVSTAAAAKTRRTVKALPTAA